MVLMDDLTRAHAEFSPRKKGEEVIRKDTGEDGLRESRKNET